MHQHQAEAIGLALAGESHVLTTGTGSGKSLSYFIPIVDACLKAKKADPTPRTARGGWCLGLGTGIRLEF